MGYENDADALASQPFHHAEKLLHFIVIQRGRRLIKDQNLTLHIHCTGNCDHLLQRQRIFFQILRHINVQIQILHQLCRHLVHLAAVDCTNLRKRLPSDEKILCDRKVRTEVYFLIHC